MQPLEVGGDLNLSFANMNEMRGKIREGMDISPAPMEMTDKAVQTATFWLTAKEREMEATSEIQTDFRDKLVVPLIRQAVVALRKAGKMPTLFKMDKRKIQIRVMGDGERKQALSRVRSRMVALEASAQFPQEVVAATVKMSEVLSSVWRDLGEGKFINTPDEQAAIEQQMMAYQQQQQQAGAA